jgi:hypothetical protein
MASTSYIRFDPSQRVVLMEPAQTDKAKVWSVIGGMSYYHGPRNQEYWIYVPNGYRTSGLELPGFLRNLLLPCHAGGQATIVYSYLRDEGKVRINGFRDVIGRDKAIEIFREAMVVANVSKFKRWLLYWAVRLLDV